MSQSAAEKSRGNITDGPVGNALVPLVGFVSALCVFVLYLRTLAPTVLYYDLPELRDSAVLQTRAYWLGIPDYTGYPTYIMLGKLFTYLPFGDIAYRVNLASAVYAALATFFVFLAARFLTGRILPAIVASVGFGVGPLLWSQAVIAEVYTLNALVISVVLFLLVLWRESRRDRYLLVACFAMGLALTHHLTSGLLLPAAFVFVGMVDRRKLVEWKLALKGAGLFVLGLAPYLYLPIRASMDYLPQGIVWGQPLVRKYPPDTFYGFYNLVSGGQWKGRMWAFGPEELPARVSMYLDFLYGSAGQMVWPLAVVGVVGVFYMLYRDRAAGITLGFLYAGWLFYALEYNIEDIEYYFIPTFLVFWIFVSYGVSGVMDVAERVVGSRSVPRHAVVFVVAGVALLASLAGVRETYAANDMSDDYHGQEIIDAVARDAEPNATILHHRSPLDYMILVEGKRKDLTLVPYLEDPHPYGVARGITYLDDGPVYILFPGRSTTPYYLGVQRSVTFYRYLNYDLVPVDENALLYRVVRPGEARQQQRQDAPVDPSSGETDEPVET